ncbi:hypothetical protein PHZ_p0316 (plasmid) [Phenylobacterium zucineum HLK1]|uniref:Uncharacterized protein n=1 Tax=Phenylobacterium zucineum (strain HLK1) TaxID=450851 RepID=B4RIT3_PHEZH|nr:hypothetical protein PHZ_p0316 [Phenylobacterium zucineum HLK1]
MQRDAHSRPVRLMLGCVRAGARPYNHLRSVGSAPACWTP